MSIAKTNLCLVCGLIALVSLDVGAKPAARVTGQQIMRRVYEREDGDDSRMVMRIVLTNKRGRKRVRKIRSISKEQGRDTKTIMEVEAPADVRGTRFLQYDYDRAGKEDDRWLYLPALKKVRRIYGSAKADRFMGTDFTYEDMGTRNPAEDRHRLLEEEKLDGATCWVVRSTPREQDHIYSKRVSWIDKRTLITRKTLYYDRQGQLFKVLRVGSVRQQDGIWTAFRLRMRDVQQSHTTDIIYDQVTYNRGVSDHLFRVAALERGRIE